jgi:hypothetical protein
MFHNGSGDELCGPLPALFQAVGYHLPAVSPSAFAAFVYSCGTQLLAPPPFSGALSATPPLCSVLVFSSLFIIQFLSFFLLFSLCSGLCWFIPGVAVGIPHDAWCSPVWYAECLPSRLDAGI